MQTAGVGIELVDLRSLSVDERKVLARRCLRACRLAGGRGRLLGKDETEVC
jgi:hypothetical protein